MTETENSPVHSVFMRNGQRLFAYDIEKQEMNEVIPEEADDLDLGTNLSIRRKKVDIKEGHLYIVALNRKNAFRKLLNMTKNV